MLMDDGLNVFRRPLHGLYQIYSYRCVHLCSWFFIWYH